MNRSRLQIAKRRIQYFFDHSPMRAFRKEQLAEVLHKQRGRWQLADGTSTDEFIFFLEHDGKLTETSFPFPHRSERAYVWGDAPLLEVLLTAKKDCYYTHHTAIYLNGLCEPMPPTIFINHEQRPHHNEWELEQERIDAAFRRPARVSNNVIDYNGNRVCLVNGMHTGRLGVVEREVEYAGRRASVRVTDLERTLIDAAVRPVYCGGVGAVIEAYQHSKGRVSVPRLAEVLDALSYTYPYHQAIGFYLERAGFDRASLRALRQIPMDFEFYLTNQMEKTAYVREWRLHVPAELR